MDLETKDLIVLMSQAGSICLGFFVLCWLFGVIGVVLEGV